MSDPARLMVILVLAIGLVLSYPTLTYPPIRKAARRVARSLGWPVRAMKRAGLAIATTPREWTRLQNEILRLAELAQQREHELTDAAGRMWLETQLFPHKPTDLIRNADRNHGALTELHAELIGDTFGRPVSKEEWFQRHEKAFRPPPKEDWWQVDLWLTWIIWKGLAAVLIVGRTALRRIPPYRVRTPRALRELVDEWRSLTRRQARLRGVIDKIPERTKIYDLLESAKDLEREQKKAHDALLRPLKTAQVALEGAKGYIRRLQLRRQQAPTKGSAVLSLEQVLKQWQARIRMIEEPQVGQRRSEDVIVAIRALERDMAMAGTYAAKVIQVERRAQQIQSLHKRLKKRSRGHHLPDEELKVVTIAIRDVVPQLWLEARWDELSDALSRTQQQIRTYEREVLIRAWHLQAGTFEQLLNVVFRTSLAATALQMRINPQSDDETRRAADGSSKLSPFAERLQEFADGDSSRFAHRR